MIEIIQDVTRGELLSAYAIGAFDEAKSALKVGGYEVISLEEQAGLRVQEGVESNVSRSGNWTKEGIIYVPNKGTFLTKRSPIMTNASEATNCHRRGNDFYLSDEQVEESLEKAVQITLKEIPTNRFADEQLTIFAFGSNARKYGEFLDRNGIKKIKIYLAGGQDKPFVKQTWFYRVGSVGKSGFDGDYWGLGFSDNEVRGVRRNASAA